MVDREVERLKGEPMMNGLGGDSLAGTTAWAECQRAMSASHDPRYVCQRGMEAHAAGRLGAENLEHCKIVVMGCSAAPACGQRPLNSRDPTRGAPVHPTAAAILSRQTKRRML
jgi:hypothetical protein